jgi:O-antigen/teichoic acid export membrane protein
MSLQAQVTQGLKWQAVNIAGRQLISLVVFTILARLLDPADFGLMGLIYVYLLLTGMLTDQGMGTALVQRSSLQPQHWDTAFWFGLGCASVLCLGTIYLATPLALLLGEPRLAPLLRWASLSIVFSAAASIPQTFFAREMDFRRPALRNLVGSLTGGGVGISMALTGCGVWALVGQQLAGSIIGTAFLWLVSTYRPALRFSYAHLRELLGVSSSVFVSTLISFITSRLDQIVIGRFAGASDLGLYVVAGKAPELGKMAILQPITEVLLPAMAKLQHDHSRMRQVIYQGTELNAVVMFAVFVGIAAISTDLVPVLFGNKWAPAADVCALLSLYALAGALQVFFYPALIATGLSGSFVALSVTQAIGVLLACVAGIGFGVPYLVGGLILNSLLLAVPFALLLHRRIGLSPLACVKPCLVPAGASLLMLVMIRITTTILPVDIKPWLRLTFHVAVGASAYIGFILLFKPAVLQDLWHTIAKALRRAQLA